MKNPLKSIWRRIDQWDKKRFYDAHARKKGYKDWADYIYQKWGIGEKE